MITKTKTTQEWMITNHHSKYNATALDSHRVLSSGAIVSDVVSINDQPVTK